MSSKPYAGQQIDPARAAALNKLHQRISTAIDAGAEIPCSGVDRDLWISEHRSDQLEASDRCADCPLMLQCRAYVLEFPEHTVMGGEMPSPIQKARSK